MGRSVHSTSTTRHERVSSIDHLDQTVAVVEQKHQQLDRVESDTTMLKSALTSLTSSQQEVEFKCYRDVSNLG